VTKTEKIAVGFSHHKLGAIEREHLPRLENAQLAVSDFNKFVTETVGLLGFDVPLDRLYVILRAFLRVTWPNQQSHSTEGQWLVNHVKGQSHQAQLVNQVKGQSHQAQLVNHVKGQSHQAQLIKIWSKECNKKLSTNNYSKHSRITQQARQQYSTVCEVEAHRWDTV